MRALWACAFSLGGGGAPSASVFAESLVPAMRRASLPAARSPAHRVPSRRPTLCAARPCAARLPQVAAVLRRHMSTVGVRSLYRITPEVTSPPLLSFFPALTLGQADTERLECTPDQLLAIVPGLQIRDLQFGTPHPRPHVSHRIASERRHQAPDCLYRGTRQRGPHQRGIIARHRYGSWQRGVPSLTSSAPSGGITRCGQDRDTGTSSNAEEESRRRVQ